MAKSSQNKAKWHDILLKIDRFKPNILIKQSKLGMKTVDLGLKMMLFLDKMSPKCAYFG